MPGAANGSNAPLMSAADAVDRIVKYLRGSNDNAKGLEQLLTSLGAPQNPKIIQVTIVFITSFPASAIIQWDVVGNLKMSGHYLVAVVFERCSYWTNLISEPLLLSPTS